MMRCLSLPLRSAFALAVRAALVVAAVSLFGACDRHSAEELPENYGHGSSHERAVPDHQADSTGRDHFSDSGGLDKAETKEETAFPKPAPSVTGKGF